MPYSTKSRSIKGTEMALGDAMKHRLNLVILANSTFCGGSSKEERRFSDRKQWGLAATTMGAVS